MSSNLKGDKYQLTIGLEIHAELKTKTKMFCDSANDPDPPAGEASEKRPNVNICPICLGHPGILPTINQKAVEHVLRVGLAVGGTLADFTEFDRKNYFYPDIPKGYQISQHQYPLITSGAINGVKITRVHLEEDTARSIHSESGKDSLIDFNRAGVPLMELVTEPVITSAKQAGDFARELQLLLRYLNVSEANMEKGEMRVEANISVIPRFDLENPKRSNLKLGTKVEVKNLNSFRSVEQAIQYEFKRQTELLEAGGKVVQETRGWDETKGITFSQRLKESSHDYRYFPDPDLPKLRISEIEVFKNLSATIPELPWQKRERYARDFGIKTEDVEMFVTTPELAHFFEAVTEDLKEDKKLIQLATNYITNDLIKLINGDYTKLNKQDKNFAVLIVMIGDSEVSSRGAKDILTGMIVTGESPREIAEAKGLFQKSDTGELQTIAEKIIADNPKVVIDYRAGKQASLQFLIGQGMKASKGSANPEILKNLFTKILT
ncbi:MAG: Asp-tRNA(Asn)/Glu-tRNA(Gln) amidotransferase subunit GatB [Candidatus Vogelbacteria bacterium]